MSISNLLSSSGQRRRLDKPGNKGTTQEHVSIQLHDVELVRPEAVMHFTSCPSL